MTTPANLPPEPSATITYRNVDELVDQVVDVSAIEELKGIPIVVVGGERYLVTDVWGEQGAGAMEAAFETSGVETVTVLVKRAANGDVGFAVPPTP